MMREFLEVDEANLLEEEDMHMFGSTPMSDPLHLVSCNGCKRPIIASQYAAHAERCWVLNQLEGTIMELNVGNKKSTMKGAQRMVKSQEQFFLHVCAFEGKLKHNSCYQRKDQGSRTAGKEKSEYRHADSMNSSLSKLDEYAGSMHTLSREVKRIITNVPTPLATKLYYIGRSYRLRAALNRLYDQSEVRDLRNNSSLKVMQDTVSSSQESGFFIGGGAYMCNVTSERISRG